MWTTYLESLRAVIQRLLERASDADECYEMFRQILLASSRTYIKGFLAALAAKVKPPKKSRPGRPSSSWTRPSTSAGSAAGETAHRHGPVETFNVSSAAAVVAAAGGAHRAPRPGGSLRCGHRRFAEAVGLPWTAMSRPCAEHRKVRIGLFNGMSAHCIASSLFRILSRSASVHPKYCGFAATPATDSRGAA